jgi:peptidoglycan/LPS O-acetylase OafA/YrhL
LVSGWSRPRVAGGPSTDDPPPVRTVSAPGTTRLEGIDGLRALAACSILVYHVWLYSQPGGQRVDFGPMTRFVFPHLPLGVTLFFTLSAFLLYRPIVAAIVDGRPRPRVRTYLLNRGLRIMPAYLVVLVVVAVVLPAAMLRTGPTTLEPGRMVGDPALLLRNAALAQNYAPESLLTGITPAWSLAVEAVFYLVLPLLGGLAAAVAAARRVDGRNRLIAALIPAAVLLAVGLSGKAVAASWIVSTGSPSAGWDGDWYSVIVRSFWGQADLFTFRDRPCSGLRRARAKPHLVPALVAVAGVGRRLGGRRRDRDPRRSWPLVGGHQPVRAHGRARLRPPACPGRPAPC